MFNTIIKSATRIIATKTNDRHILQGEQQGVSFGKCCNEYFL